MSIIPTQWDFLLDVAKLINRANDLGFVLTAGEMWRTEVQAWINALPGGSKLTAGNPNTGIASEYGSLVGGVGILQSKHRDRLAVDFNVFRKDGLILLNRREEIEPLGVYWESLNPKNRWGGRFERVDAPHFERTI